jgi:hypothetical protein
MSVERASAEYLTAYTNYCSGRGWRELGNQYWDKLSIYAFSLLRRPDHSAGAGAMPARMHTHRRRLYCAIYEKERPRRARCATADMDARRRSGGTEFPHVSIPRLYRGCPPRQPPLRSSASIGSPVSFCKFIASADHMKQQRPPSTVHDRSEVGRCHSCLDALVSSARIGTERDRLGFRHAR